MPKDYKYTNKEETDKFEAGFNKFFGKPTDEDEEEKKRRLREEALKRIASGQMQRGEE